jgi:hypothetical protein
MGFKIAVEAKVEIVKSSKKIKVIEQEAQTNAYGDVEIDLAPVMVVKEVTIETFEVGIQTDEFEVSLKPVEIPLQVQNLIE